MPLRTSKRTPYIWRKRLESLSQSLQNLQADLRLAQRDQGATQLDLALEPRFNPFLVGARHHRPPFQRGLPITLFDLQKELVQDFFSHQINFWEIGRQVTKTSLCALLLCFLSKEISGDVLVESYHMERSQEIILYTKEYCREHVDPFYVENMANDATDSLVFKTGLRIIALPSGQSARGYSPILLVTDESQLIPDDDISAFLPTTLATAAKRLHMGTVHGTNNWFWRLGQRHVELGYGYRHIRSEEAVRPNGPVIKAELDRLKLELGELKYQEECDLLPIPDIGNFFGNDLVNSAFGTRI